MKLNFKAKTSLFLLSTIVLLGLFLRFYQLGQVPSSLNWDEASWGYSAYSVLETGKDEYGRFLPTSFEALGDFKQPLYVYSELIPIKIFGLNAFSVRFPSAFFGTLSILFIYLLVKRIFAKREDINIEALSLLSALFFAISPWSIQFSRVAYEANTALFFILSGVWAFLRGLESKSQKWLTLGIILISLSSYTYHSSKIFVPVFFGFLLLYAYFFKKIQNKLIIILLGIFVLINLLWVVDMRTTQRGRSVLFLNSQNLLEEPTREAVYDINSRNVGTFFHSPKIIYVNKYLENYLSHFNPVWLFFEGDQDRHHAPGFGLLYPFDMAFILIGIFFLLKYFNKKYLFLFVWFFIAPAASAMAIEAPNASRSLVMLPIWLILGSVGWVVCFKKISIIRLQIAKYLMLILLVSISTFYFLSFLHQYFVHTNSENEISWQYGYKEAIQWTNENSSREQKIVFSQNFENPYIFYLFYTKASPGRYISEEAYKKVTDRERCFNMENYYFGNCKQKLLIGDIYVTLNGEDYEKGKLLKTFKYSNGPDVIRIYESR